MIGRGVSMNPKWVFKGDRSEDYVASTEFEARLPTYCIQASRMACPHGIWQCNEEHLIPGALQTERSQVMNMVIAFDEILTLLCTTAKFKMYDIQYRMLKGPGAYMWEARHMWLPSLSLLRPRIPMLKMEDASGEELRLSEAHDRLDAVLIAFDFAVEESDVPGALILDALYSLRMLCLATDAWCQKECPITFGKLELELKPSLFQDVACTERLYLYFHDNRLVPKTWGFFTAHEVQDMIYDGFHQRIPSNYTTTYGFPRNSVLENPYIIFNWRNSPLESVRMYNVNECFGVVHCSQFTANEANCIASGNFARFFKNARYTETWVVQTEFAYDSLIHDDETPAIECMLAPKACYDYVADLRHSLIGTWIANTGICAMSQSAGFLETYRYTPTYLTQKLKMLHEDYSALLDTLKGLRTHELCVWVDTDDASSGSQPNFTLFDTLDRTMSASVLQTRNLITYYYKQMNALAVNEAFDDVRHEFTYTIRAVNRHYTVFRLQMHALHCSFRIVTLYDVMFRGETGARGETQTGVRVAQFKELIVADSNAPFPIAKLSDELMGHIASFLFDPDTYSVMFQPVFLNVFGNLCSSAAQNTDVAFHTVWEEADDDTHYSGVRTNSISFLFNNGFVSQSESIQITTDPLGITVYDDPAECDSPTGVGWHNYGYFLFDAVFRQWKVYLPSEDQFLSHAIETETPIKVYMELENHADYERPHLIRRFGLHVEGYEPPRYAVELMSEFSSWDKYEGVENDAMDRFVNSQLANYVSGRLSAFVDPSLGTNT